MNTRTGVYLGMTMVLVFAILADGQEPNSLPSPWDKLGRPAPALAGLQWVKGSPVEFKKGSVYVVEFWATWCPPCKASIPHLTQLQKQFKDKGVTIIGISNEKPDVVEPFVTKMAEKMDYTVAISPDEQAHKAYMDLFKARGIPHAFVVDKESRLVWQGHPMAQMDQVLEQVVAGKFDYATYARTEARREEQATRLTKLYKDYFAAVEAGGDTGATGGQFVADCSDSEMLNSFAWAILTDVPEPKRNLDLARQAAAKAVQLTDEKDPSILDTYALALYEQARQYVAQAVSCQKKAVEIAEKGGQTPSDMRKALERYESASVK